ncbi:MAG: PadR family transcriptional regulator [Candidatus Eisenbacteria bacterium]|jgi:PadR family transcriptional regulator PadR|nr:PadR family transcriptional regulator [Candidatus Eisenbacteria bacterium]
MTNAELVVLGLLAEQDRYAYEIEEEIKTRSVRAWARVGFSSIYHALGALERKGLVMARKADSPLGPDRKVFAITDEGRLQLRAGSLSRLAERLPLPSSFYVGLSLIPHLEHGAAIEALRRHAEQLATRREEPATTLGDAPLIARAMRELGERLAQAEAAWLDRFIEQVTKAPEES